MDSVRGTKRLSLLLVGGLLLLAYLLYFPPYATEFIGDDYVQLGMVAGWVENPAGGIAAFDPGWSGWYYRPLQNLWFLLNRLLFGLNAAGYYGLTILWHLLATALVYATGRRLRLPQPASLAGTALFAVHVQHHSVVAWVSSAAILMHAAFALAAFASYLHARRARPHRRWLALTALFSILALFSHESGVLLPVFLLAHHLLTGGRLRRSATGRTLLLLLAAALLLGAVHVARPNLTLTVQGAGVSPYLAALRPAAIFDFLTTVVASWTLLTVPPGVPGGALLLLLLLALLAWAAARRGPLARAGLLWAALHLAFVYFALWAQKPELFAGRHLYAAAAGLVLALAALLPARLPRAGRVILIVALLSWLGLQAGGIAAAQRAWLSHAGEVAQAEARLRAILPQASPQTRIFANRFVLVPAYAPYAAAVWYAQPEIGGGSLQRFKAAGWLTPADYLLDYEDGMLTNLMPALQQVERTQLLWQPALAAGGAATAVQSDVVAGPAPDRRLAIAVQPAAAESLTLVYTLPALPAGAALAVAFWGEPGLRYTALLVNGEPILLGQGEITGEGGWQEMALVLPATLPPAARLQLTVTAPQAAPGRGYWTIPRLTVGSAGPP